MLVESLSVNGIDAFVEENKRLLSRGDVLEFFAVLLSEDTGYEIFEVFTEDSPEIRAAFVNSLKWRNSRSITDKLCLY